MNVVKRKGICQKCFCSVESIMSEKQDFKRFGMIDTIPCPNCSDGIMQMVKKG